MTSVPPPGNVKITIKNFDKTVSIDTAGLLYNNTYLPTFDEYDAIANVNVDLKTFSNMFCFQTDYIDVNNETNTDVKYYVLSDKINYFIPSLGSSIVSQNPIVSFTSTGTIQTEQVIGKDFTRYLSQLLFNTPYGVDLFVNEKELVDSTSYALYTAWSHCITDLQNISNESTNLTIPLEGNAHAKYLTDNFTDVKNICREMFLQLITNVPSRFVNLPQINVEDEWTQTIGENSNLKYYYLPFINNDIIPIRIKIYPSINQPTFGLSTTNTNKFETINNDTHLKGRTYIINMILTDNLTATTRLTGKCSIKVIGKNSTLQRLDYLPIIQTANIMNITTTNTQINTNTIQCDIFYDVDTRISPTNSVLDVGFGFSTSAISYYNQNIQSIEILEFGGIPLYGKGSQFKYLTSNIIFTATDVPLVSPNTSLSFAFASMPNFNQNVMFLNKWDLLNVTTMYSMFSGSNVFNNGSITNDGLNPLTFITSSTLSNVSNMFSNCISFNQTVYISNLSNVTTMSFMFNNCSLFNNGALTLDQPKPIIFKTSSLLTNISSIFAYCNVFNQPVSITNTSNLDNIKSMFASCSNFNQKVNFNIFANVTNMESMFNGCTTFNNGSLTNDNLNPITLPNSSLVTNISSMFASCSQFNQSVSITNTNNITDTSCMFLNCSIFNQSISISSLTSVTNMASMFSGCALFNNGDIINAGTNPFTFTTSTALTNISNIFYNCNAFNQTVSISSLANVTTMASMFSGCSLFNNGNITNLGSNPLTFTTSLALKSISSMFLNCIKFNQTLSISNISNVTTMDSMLAECHLFNNGDITNGGSKPLTFTTSSSLSNISNLFYNCNAFNQTVSISSVANVTTMANMFSRCTIFNNGNVTNIGQKPLTFTTSIALQTISSMFYNCIAFNQTISIITMTNLTTMSNMFNGCAIFNNGNITNAGSKPLTFTTSSPLTNISNLFYNCNVFNQSVSISSASKVTTMASMFSGCTIFNNGDTSNLGQKQLTFTTSTALLSLESLFFNCNSFNQTISITNITNVTTMSNMFNGCTIFNNGNITNGGSKPLSFTTSSSLSNISNLFYNCNAFNQSVSISGVANVNNMANMFSGCTIFNNGNVTNIGEKPLTFTTSTKLTNTSFMFYNCNSFNQALYISNVANVTTISSMFYQCYLFNNGNTSNLGTSQLIFTTSIALTSLYRVFYSCRNFNQKVSISNGLNVTTMAEMFYDCPIFNNGSIINDGLNSWSITSFLPLTSLSNIFFNCSAFNQTVSISNVSNVTSMESMFSGCTIFNNGDTSDLGSKPLTFTTSTALKTTYQMFVNCIGFNQTISISNVENVTTLAIMFSGCTIFNNGDTSDLGSKPLTFTTSTALTTTSSMFYNCQAFNQTISISNVENVTTLAIMFSGCTIFNNGDTSDLGSKPLTFTTSTALTTTSSMFYNCQAFNQNFVITVISGLQYMTNMFYSCSVFNNGYASESNTNLLFPTTTKPIGLIGTILNFGTLSPLALATSNIPTWMTTDWVV